MSGGPSRAMLGSDLLETPKWALFSAATCVAIGRSAKETNTDPMCLIHVHAMNTLGFTLHGSHMPSEVTWAQTITRKRNLNRQFKFTEPVSGMGGYSHRLLICTHRMSASWYPDTQWRLLLEMPERAQVWPGVHSDNHRGPSWTNCRELHEELLTHFEMKFSGYKQCSLGRSENPAATSPINQTNPRSRWRGNGETHVNYCLTGILNP